MLITSSKEFRQRVAHVHHLKYFMVMTTMKPDVSEIYIFGARAYYHVPDELRRKLDAKSKTGLFVGHCKDSKAFIIWDP